MMNLAKTVVFAGLVGAIAQSAAADEVRTERVAFKKGTSGTQIEGSLKGYDTVNYLLGAGEGQNMSISFSPDNLSGYFNLFAPGMTPGEDQAMFVGSMNGNEFSGELPNSGDYTIQVYLMRNAARRDEVLTYTIDVKIDG